MKKTVLLLLALAFVSSSAVFAAVGKETKGPFGYNLYDDINRNNKAPAEKANTDSTSANNDSTSAQSSKQFYADDTEPEWVNEQMYYPNATLNSAIKKYKQGNYSGCLQEMISLTKKDSFNPVVYYYLAMAYTQVGNKTQAVKAYEQVIKLHPDRALNQYATKGRDCLVGGPTCTTEGSDNDLDEFINSDYGTGMSDELKQQMKEQELKNIQKTINQKQELEDKDIEKIQKFDDSSELPTTEKIAQATTSNDDILNAIETLKNAGMTVNVTPANMPVNNQYNDLSLLLGTNNNNNNAMMMLPYMLSQHENGKNIDPQIIQSMMMNSMLPDFTFSDNNKKY